MESQIIKEVNLHLGDMINPLRRADNADRREPGDEMFSMRMDNLSPLSFPRVLF